MNLRRTLVIILIALAVLTTALFAWYVCSHGFSAREKPLVIEAFIARNLRRLSVPSRVNSLRNPLLGTALEIAKGRDHFADHCAVCHGNRGDGNTTINQGLYPPAPDMRESETQSLSDGDLLYIIQNGVRFTGMPGWGEGKGKENWHLVSFIRHLPSLSGREVELMKEVNNLE